MIEHKVACTARLILLLQVVGCMQQPSTASTVQDVHIDSSTKVRPPEKKKTVCISYSISVIAL